MLNRSLLSKIKETPGLSPDIVKEIDRIHEDKKYILPGWNRHFLKRLGKIETIVDIGAHTGAPHLYKAFPKAYLILIESSPEFEIYCKDILEKRKGIYHICGLGGDAATSTLTPIKKKQDVDTSYEVPQYTLDKLMMLSPLSVDSIIRIDIEGLEPKTMQGAVETLARAKYVIAKVEIRRRHKEVYSFGDLIEIMDRNEYDLFDIMSVTRPRVNAPGANIADMVFRNRNI